MLPLVDQHETAAIIVVERIELTGFPDGLVDRSTTHCEP